MNKNALMRQLISMRAQIDAALFLLQDESEPPACKHVHKQNLTTMGGNEEWKCKDCGFHFQMVDHG